MAIDRAKWICRGLFVAAGGPQLLQRFELPRHRSDRYAPRYANNFLFVADA